MDVDIGLFSYTKPAENFAKDFVGADFTSDGEKGYRPVPARA